MIVSDSFKQAFAKLTFREACMQDSEDTTEKALISNTTNREKSRNYSCVDDEATLPRVQNEEEGWKQV